MSKVLAELTAKVIATLEASGPLIGRDLCAKFPEASLLDMWRVCHLSHDIYLERFARYYLRYDIANDNPVRVSPSFARDFLTFTIIGRHSHRGTLHKETIRLAALHREISNRKLGIARHILLGFEQAHPDYKEQRIAAFIGGDIAFFLAHDEPRPSHSSPDIMKGSDIDIVFAYDPAQTSTGFTERLERYLLEQKFFYMKSPEHREELDFIVKPLAKFHEQFQGETVRAKIASKIVNESIFLWGSESLYNGLKADMESSPIKALLEEDLSTALTEREQAFQQLLQADSTTITEETKRLFYFSQERIEFE